MKAITYPEIGAIYMHYKGGKYEVITLANHHETGEALVIYKSVAFGGVYARPLSEWYDGVDAKSPRGVQKTRFEYVKSK